MIDDIILNFLFLAGGILIGLNLKHKPIIKEVKATSEDMEKLQEELIVYKNLRESLMADVKYWRDKASKK